MKLNKTWGQISILDFNGAQDTNYEKLNHNETTDIHKPLNCVIKSHDNYIIEYPPPNKELGGIIAIESLVLCCLSDIQ